MPDAPDSLAQADPEIMSGTPVFAGTRVPLQALHDYLEAGSSLSEFFDDFPTVSRAQVLAVAGADTKHANAIATAVRQAAEDGDYVTPQLLDAKLGALRADMRADLGCEITTLTWRLIGAGIAIAGLTVAVLRLLG